MFLFPGPVALLAFVAAGFMLLLPVPGLRKAAGKVFLGGIAVAVLGSMVPGALKAVSGDWLASGLVLAVLGILLLRTMAQTLLGILSLIFGRTAAELALGSTVGRLLTDGIKGLARIVLAATVGPAKLVVTIANRFVRR